MGTRGSSMSNSYGKRRHYSTLLLLALGAAVLSLLVVHKLREGRVLGLLLLDRERQLLSLQMILEKERVHSNQMRVKIEELKAKAASLRTQKMHLNNRLMEAENLAAYLKNKRAELEWTLEEKQNKLASLKDMEEASMKANLRVAALTDLLKQQQDHAEEIERHLQQPLSQLVNATLVDDVSRRNETDESTRKEEVAAIRDSGAQTVDGAKQVQNSQEHEQGSKRGEWVRLQTNTDDGESADNGDDNSGEEEDHGKEEASEEIKHPVEGTQAGDQGAVEVRDENQINGTEFLLNTPTHGEVPIMNGEVTSSNTTETSVGASEEGNSQQDEESSKVGENPDSQVLDRNATEVSSGEVIPKLPTDQTASTEAEVAEQQTQNQTNTISLEASAGNTGDANSETKGASIESYQDTNGLEEKSDGDDKNGIESGENQTVSSGEESNLSDGARHEDGGQETREENNIRSTVEISEESAASNEGHTEKLNGTEEGESSGKEAEGNEQAGSEQLRERDEGDGEKKPDVSTDSIQQQASATEVAEDGEGDDESQLEQEPEDENLTEEKHGDENKAEEAAGGKIEHEEAVEDDEGSKEDVKEF